MAPCTRLWRRSARQQASYGHAYRYSGGNRLQRKGAAPPGFGVLTLSSSTQWHPLRTSAMQADTPPSSNYMEDMDEVQSQASNGAKRGRWRVRDRQAMSQQAELSAGHLAGPDDDWESDEYYSEEGEQSVEDGSDDEEQTRALRLKDTTLQADSVPALVALVYSTNPGVQAGAVTVLHEMDYDELITARMVAAGVVPAFVHVLQDSTDATQKAAVRVLIRLASNQEGYRHVLASGGLVVIVKLLENSSADVQGEAAWALNFLAQTNSGTHTVIAEAGGIPLLVRLLLHHSAKVQYDSWYMSTTTHDTYCKKLQENEDSVNVLLPAVDALEALADPQSGLQDAIIAAGATQALLRCLQSPCSGVQERAQAALDALQVAS